MRIATWNVNSIRSRILYVQEWLKKNNYDIVLMQELKCTDEQFPYTVFEELNYNTIVFGQPTYNGVAIASKYPIEIITKGIPHFNDPSARYIECLIKDMVIASVYIPNGGEINSDKYLYKLDFFKHLTHYLKKRLIEEHNFLLAGDFNVALSDIDVFDPEAMYEKTCFSISERQAMRQLLNVGFIDALRATTQEQIFTWWDYRGGALRKNHGMRLDYILLTSVLLKKLKIIETDKNQRYSDKPSDHIPVICTLV